MSSETTTPSCHSGGLMDRSIQQRLMCNTSVHRNRIQQTLGSPPTSEGVIDIVANTGRFGISKPGKSSGVDVGHCDQESDFGEDLDWGGARTGVLGPPFICSGKPDAIRNQPHHGGSFGSLIRFAYEGRQFDIFCCSRASKMIERMLST